MQGRVELTRSGHFQSYPGRSEPMFIPSDPRRRLHSLALSQLQRLSVVALKT